MGRRSPLPTHAGDTRTWASNLAIQVDGLQLRTLLVLDAKTATAHTAVYMPPPPGFVRMPAGQQGAASQHRRGPDAVPNGAEGAACSPTAAARLGEEQGGPPPRARADSRQEPSGPVRQATSKCPLSVILKEPSARKAERSSCWPCGSHSRVSAMDQQVTCHLMKAALHSTCGCTQSCCRQTGTAAGTCSSPCRKRRAQVACKKRTCRFTGRRAGSDKQQDGRHIM